MAVELKHFYEFGPFRIDVSERSLSRDGRIVAITPKAFDLLLMLVRNSGETVDKETLMKEVWPNSFVEEGSLPVNMTALRRALGESTDEHTYIETVPRRGYRFVASVTENWVHDGRPDSRKRWPRLKVLVGSGMASVETLRAPAPAPAARKREMLAWALAAVGIGTAAVLAVYYAGRPASRPTVVRATIPLPENAVFNRLSINDESLGGVAVSPDGLQIAFAAASHGTGFLWLRPLGGLSARALPGTEGARLPFWSPDGRFIGFFDFAGSKLKRIEVSGGAIQTICDVPTGRGGCRGGTCSRDGVIVFALDRSGPLYRVSAAGGQPAPLWLDNESEQIYLRYPSFLPDGRHFIYRAGATSSYSRNERNGIYVGSLESSESKVILRGDTYAVYASGHLLFWRDGALMAQPFDEKSLQLTSDAVQVAELVQFNPRFVEADFSVAENGVLVFVSGAPGTGQLVWFDRDGKQAGKLGEPSLVCNPRISPDGTRVAVQILDPEVGTSDIWVYDLTRNVKARLTLDPATDSCPVWSPDGTRIAFSSNRKGLGRFHIYQMDSRGSGNEDVLFESDERKFPQSWSSDGRFIAYTMRRMSSTAQTEIWVLPLIAEQKPFPLLQSQLNQGDPQFSPDERFVAYRPMSLGASKFMSGPSQSVAASSKSRQEAARSPAGAGTVRSFSSWLRTRWWRLT